MTAKMVVAMMVFMSVGIARTASAIPIGLGSGLSGATNLDSEGSRTLVEGLGTLLAAGQYTVTDFQYLASSNAGNLQPFLALSTGTDMYEVIWVGANDLSLGPGPQIQTYTGQSFLLATGATVFAGFNQSSPIMFFADPDGPSTTDLHGPSFALTVGGSLGSFSNPNLDRNYAFSVSVEEATTPVPEPASLALLGLGLAGLGFGRYQKNTGRTGQGSSC